MDGRVGCSTQLLVSHGFHGGRWGPNGAQMLPLSPLVPPVADCDSRKLVDFLAVYGTLGGGFGLLIFIGAIAHAIHNSFKS